MCYRLSMDNRTCAGMLFAHKLPKMNTWSCHIPIINLHGFSLSLGWSSFRLFTVADSGVAWHDTNCNPPSPIFLLPLLRLKISVLASLLWFFQGRCTLSHCWALGRVLFLSTAFDPDPSLFGFRLGFLGEHFLTLPAWFKHHSWGLQHVHVPCLGAYQTTQQLPI